MIFEYLFAVRSKSDLEAACTMLGYVITSECRQPQHGIVNHGFNGSGTVFSLKQEPDDIEYVIKSGASGEKILLIGKATANGIIITQIEKFTNV
jgi:hypothetical protein